jgi:hypothetical protein
MPAATVYQLPAMTWVRIKSEIFFFKHLINPQTETGEAALDGVLKASKHESILQKNSSLSSYICCQIADKILILRVIFH